ncbi:MAG: substrate-binding domain-containing protein, partial [Anaerolineae bacterium]|nr:substrate-binding domain-containing protein [Anaerolineae bacterium]
MNATVPYKRPTIGVLAGWQFYRTATNLSYLAPIFRGITHAAQKLGCNLLLGCGMGPSASPTDPLRPAWPVFSPDQDFVSIGPWNTDGLIIAVPLHSQERSEYIQGLIAAGHPVLFVGSGETGPTIAVNNAGGILEAMHHLVEHGHRQIAFIAGTVEDMRGDSGERLRAYQSGCESYGLENDPRRVAYGRHVYDGGYIAMQQIMVSGVEFSAVVASNDESALGAMQALKEAGRKIPEDVAITGFDNRLEGAVHQPGLSSIHVPLFNMGYRAVDLLLEHIEGKTQLPELVNVDTHLVIRASCGCNVGKYASRETEPSPTGQPGEEWASWLARMIASTIMNQAHNLTEDEGLALCQQLVDTFNSSVRRDDNAQFQDALAAALQVTAAGDDDTHIWQDAISLLERAVSTAGSSLGSDIYDLLGEARLTISAAMQRQHRHYVMDERWTSSRLSLLTARLLNALDEVQIYDILATHLPDMGIHIALLGLFEADGDDPVAWTTIHNTINPDQGVIRFRSREFPPANLFTGEHQFILTLIPLVDQSGQIGFMVFDAEQLDLYGSIVQQLGGALNTARLY